jgi:hypothetical protein
MKEHFDTQVGTLFKDGRYTDIYSCNDCGALVGANDRAKHVTGHKTMKELLALAHQLVDTVKAIHSASHHHLT